MSLDKEINELRSIASSFTKTAGFTNAEFQRKHLKEIEKLRERIEDFWESTVDFESALDFFKDYVKKGDVFRDGDSYLEKRLKTIHKVLKFVMRDYGSGKFGKNELIKNVEFLLDVVKRLDPEQIDGGKMEIKRMEKAVHKILKPAKSLNVLHTEIYDALVNILSAVTVSANLGNPHEINMNALHGMKYRIEDSLKVLNDGEWRGRASVSDLGYNVQRVHGWLEDMN